ncbi:MAG: nucleotidyltransferase domain-containing protein [Treponema sp.]|nr:nucleotidyltransferase domain-containing protein [Treponema sp.]
MAAYEAVKDELITLIQAISQAVPVEEIYLFGSYAYGTPDKDSDLDIYVVLSDEITMRELDIMEQIWDVIYPIKTKPVDLLAVKRKSFLLRKQSPTLERLIAEHGIKLYG